LAAMFMYYDAKKDAHEVAGQLSPESAARLSFNAATASSIQHRHRGARKKSAKKIERYGRRVL